MIMRSLMFVIGSFYLILATAYSQQDFKKGFIVLDEDTIPGLINTKPFVGVPKNPTFIKFKTDPADKAIIYRVADLSHIEIAGADIYTRADIYGEDICGGEEEERYINPWMQTAWLRLIVRGEAIDLYRWNNRLYIKTDGNYFEELKYEDQDLPIYKKQLSNIAEHYGLSDKLSKTIEQCQYNNKDIGNIIVTLNRGKGKIIPLNPATWKLSFFLGMGIGIGSVDLYTLINAPTIHFTNRGLSFFSVGTVLSPSFTTLFLRFELSSSSGSFIGESAGYQKAPIYTYSQQNISSGISILNTFYNNGIEEFYGGLTGNQNFSAYKRNFTTVVLNGGGWEGNFEMKESWRSLGITAGAIINQRWGASLTAQPCGKFATNASVILKNRAFFLTFRYHF